MTSKPHVNMFSDVDVRYADVPDSEEGAAKGDSDVPANSICQACRKKLDNPSSGQKIELPKYFCGYCHRKLQHKHSLWVHLIHHTASMKRPPFTCPLCKKVFDTLSGYKLHLGSLHSVKPSHDCPDCSEKFIDRKMFEAHQLRHKPTTTAQEFRNRETVTHLLEFHQSIVCQDCASRLQHICTLCEEMFNRKEELKHHILDVHFHCPTCPVSFIKKTDLFEHMNQLHAAVSLENCTACPIPVEETNEVANNAADDAEDDDSEDASELKVEGKPVSRCTECKAFYLEDNSSDEIDSELCSHCRNTGPKKRRRTDPSAEIFLCEKCNSQFSSMKEMQEHAKTHAKKETEKNDKSKVKCSICRSQFSSMEELHNHNERSHHYCNVCRAAFHEKSHLIFHIVASHQEKNPIICQGCKQLYVTVYQTDPTEAFRQVNGLQFIYQSQTTDVVDL